MVNHHDPHYRVKERAVKALIYTVAAVIAAALNILVLAAFGFR